MKLTGVAQVHRVLWLGPMEGGFTVSAGHDLAVHHWTPDAGRESLLAQLKGVELPDLVIVDSHLPGAVRAVEAVVAVAPGLQIVFLATDQQQAALRQQIFPVGRIGSHWRIADPTRESVSDIVSDGARLTQRRRQLRTTLDRFYARRQMTRLESDHARPLAASSHFLASIMAQARDAIVATDLYGVIIVANDAAEHMWNRPSAKLIQTHVWENVSESGRPELRRTIATVASQSRPTRCELELLRPDGTTVPVELTLGPVRGEGGHCIACSLILRDISERKEAAATLARHAAELQKLHDAAVAASRAKDDFLAALSHELRNPLNPVLLIASDAASDESLPPAIREAFETIYKNVELEARLIDDLLDLTRIAQRKVPLDFRPHDLHQLVRGVLAMIDAELAEKFVSTRLDLAAPTPVVLADSVRMQQVLWNVLKNAVKFTPENGRITIRSEILENQRAVRLEVTDTGIGMTAAELAHVFDAFVQGKHAQEGSHRFGGLGLGLAISRSLIELHHGRLWATSPGQGLGSTFTIDLPLLEVKSLSTASTTGGAGYLRPAHAHSPALNLLLVEDHAATRFTLERLLTRRNWHVFAAATVAEAVTILETTSIDLLVSDIGLPDGNGHRIMTEARQRNANVIGIALTGYGTEDDVQKSHSSGFAFHLTKPVTIQSLDQALEAINPLRRGSSPAG